VNQWIWGCESFTATGENGAAACNRNRSARQLNRQVKRKDRDQSTGIESLTSANNRTTLTRPFSDLPGRGSSQNSKPCFRCFRCFSLQSHALIYNKFFFCKALAWIFGADSNNFGPARPMRSVSTNYNGERNCCCTLNIKSGK
jgi:hypothetical protein